MIEFIKKHIESGDIVAAHINALTEEEARNLSMINIITDDPEDGSILEYWLSDFRGIETVADLLHDGLNFYNTPVIAF